MEHLPLSDELVDCLRTVGRFPLKSAIALDYSNFGVNILCSYSFSAYDMCNHFNGLDWKTAHDLNTAKGAIKYYAFKSDLLTPHIQTIDTLVSSFDYKYLANITLHFHTPKEMSTILERAARDTYESEFNKQVHDLLGGKDG